MPPSALTFAVLGIVVAVELALIVALKVIVIVLFAGKINPPEQLLVSILPSTQMFAPISLEVN